MQTVATLENLAMTAGNTPSAPPPPPSGPISWDVLAPLAAAWPGRPTGRVRSLEEARRALRIPTSADDEVLGIWGVPNDFQLAVYPIKEADAPDRVAEFALLRVLERSEGDLVARDRRTQLRLEEKNNA